jgi:hypothetical protein
VATQPRKDRLVSESRLSRQLVGGDVVQPNELAKVLNRRVLLLNRCWFVAHEWTRILKARKLKSKTCALCSAEYYYKACRKGDREAKAVADSASSVRAIADASEITGLTAR